MPWNSFRKDWAWLQTTKVAKHPKTEAHGQHTCARCLSKKQKKGTLIAELKARGKDNYKKNQRGSNIGEPAAEVKELMLRNMLRDANDGNDIVVLKSTSAGSSWKARGAGPNST